MAVPLTRAWIEGYRGQLDPLLSPIQQVAMEAVWEWFDSLWEIAQVPAEVFGQLQREAMPLFDRVLVGPERDSPIVDLVEFLRNIGSDAVHPVPRGYRPKLAPAS